jgi:hypothetical protein
LSYTTSGSKGFSLGTLTSSMAYRIWFESYAFAIQ